jgi:malate/lactate dehydrogenase
MQRKNFNVCVTGGAGQIAYAFLPQLCKGLVFPDVDIHLRMLDITPAVKVMQGVALELEDCSFPYLKSVNMSLLRSNTAIMLRRCSKMLM